MSWPEPSSQADWLRQRLLERRIVVLRGPIDDTTAARVAGELLMLDGAGGEPVELHIDSEGGPLGPTLMLIDTIDLMSSPVHTVCVGRAEGGAVGVFAAGGHRLIAPHARLHLCEPPRSAEGDALHLRQLAEHAAAELAALVDRLAAATGRPAEHVEAELSVGVWLDAAGSVQSGLAHAVRTRA